MPMSRTLPNSLSPPVALNFNSKKDDDDVAPPGDVVKEMATPEGGSVRPRSLAAASQSINLLAAHLSISSRQKKVSLHHASCFLCVADARPNERWRLRTLSRSRLSLLPFSKKIHRLQFPCPDFSSTSPNYSGVVVHLLLLLKYFNITIVVVVV